MTILHQTSTTTTDQRTREDQRTMSRPFECLGRNFDGKSNTCCVIHSFIHPSIHSDDFYSASSSTVYQHLTSTLFQPTKAVFMSMCLGMHVGWHVCICYMCISMHV